MTITTNPKVKVKTADIITNLVSEGFSFDEIYEASKLMKEITEKTLRGSKR